MGQVSEAALRDNLVRYMDQAVETGVPLVVTREDGKGNVVILSEEEFNGWRETAYLLRTPANAARLLRSIQAADAGHTEAHELLSSEPSQQA